MADNILFPNELPSKTTANDGDMLLMSDVFNNHAARKINFANVKQAAKTIFGDFDFEKIIGKVVFHKESGSPTNTQNVLQWDAATGWTLLFKIDGQPRSLRLGRNAQATYQFNNNNTHYLLLSDGRKVQERTAEQYNAELQNVVQSNGVVQFKFWRSEPSRPVRGLENGTLVYIENECQWYYYHNVSDPTIVKQVPSGAIVFGNNNGTTAYWLLGTFGEMVNVIEQLNTLESQSINSGVPRCTQLIEITNESPVMPEIVGVALVVDKTANTITIRWQRAFAPNSFGIKEVFNGQMIYLELPNRKGYATAVINSSNVDIQWN